jgi:hypothetical protein
MTRAVPIPNAMRRSNTHGVPPPPFWSPERTTVCLTGAGALSEAAGRNFARACVGALFARIGTIGTTGCSFGVVDCFAVGTGFCAVDRAGCGGYDGAGVYFGAA